MNAVHRITGYDKRTERLAVKHDVPPDKLAYIASLAHVPATDADAIGSYPLEPVAARWAATAIRQSINVDRYDWFLEPFAVP